MSSQILYFSLMPNFKENQVLASTQSNLEGGMRLVYSIFVVNKRVFEFLFFLLKMIYFQTLHPFIFL